MQRARELVDKLPGIDHNRDEQVKQLDILRRQFATKTDLLTKYKNKCDFDNSAL